MRARNEPVQPHWFWLLQSHLAVHQQSGATRGWHEQYLHTAGAYENAGLCSLAIPDKEKAKKYFASAINQDPSKRSSLYELVKIEEQQGNHAAAIELLKKYPELVLTDSVFLNLASQIALNAGDKVLAGEYEYTRKTIITKANTSGVKDEYNNLLG